MNHSEAGKLGRLKANDTLIKQSEERKFKYSERPNKCAECIVDLEYEKRNDKFCSQSCSAIYFNTGRFRAIAKYCSFCKLQLNPSIENNNNKFCTKCIKNGKHLHIIYDTEIAKTDLVRKRILLEKRGHCCELCKNNIWNDKLIPLELDHIDGYHDNNIEANLRLLCPNCHAQTPTYKNKNKGNGRKIRRQRYVKDKKLD
jgi:5-methylcytosine-specific restriction endonuclease McrA